VEDAGAAPPAADDSTDGAPEGTGAEGAGVPPAEPATSGAVTGAIGGPRS
jgi:hypothetical protein